MKYYNLALEIDPKHVPALNNKGLGLITLGNLHEAIKWLDKTVEIDPKYITAIDNLKHVRKELENS